MGPLLILSYCLASAVLLPRVCFTTASLLLIYVHTGRTTARLLYYLLPLYY